MLVNPSAAGQLAGGCRLHRQNQEEEKKMGDTD